MPPTQLPSTEALVRDFVAGSRSLNDVAAEFKRRDWSPAPELTTLETMGGAEVPPPANDWTPVEVAYRCGDITQAQYDALDAARAASVAGT